MRTKIQKISKYTPSIFQGKIDFSPAHAGFSFVAEHPAERAALRILFIILATLACFYVYFVGTTILNVIGSKEARAESLRLTSVVANLEREYFTASHGLGPADGARLGLSPVSKTTYVRRPGNAAVASHQSNEI